MAASVLKIEPESECCCVCGGAGPDLLTPEEHDAGAPPLQPPLRTILLQLNNQKVLPDGRLCSSCVHRAFEAYEFSNTLSVKATPPLSEKIRALRRNSTKDGSRRHRVSYFQLETLWEFLNFHKEVAIGYNKSAQARAHSKRLWLALAKTLNSQGEGAVKDWKGWSNYWVDYKAKLKKRAATVRAAQNGTGPTDVIPLNEIEIKMLVMLGEGTGFSAKGYSVATGQRDSPVAASSHPERTEMYNGRGMSVDVQIQKMEDEDPGDVDAEPQRGPASSTGRAEESRTGGSQENNLVEISQAGRREPSVDGKNSTDPAGPLRRRRRIRPTLSAEAARQTLIDLSKARLDNETRKNELLENILRTLNRIATSVERSMGGPQT